MYAVYNIKRPRNSKFHFYLVIKRVPLATNTRFEAITNYCGQTIEATKLVDTETQTILDVHCTTTREGSDAEVYAQLARRYAGELQSLAADKGYDSQWLRETLRSQGIRPLVKHRVYAPYDHAHHARIDDDLYG